MLNIQGLSKTWGRDTMDERVALDQVSLQLRKGEFLTVIGGNGSGKSTLLNLIAGVHQPDAGRIYLDGVDLTALPEHRRAAHLSRVFQDPLLGSAGGMTVEENLALAARRGRRRGLCWGITSAERASFKKMLAQLELGLEERMSSRVGLLSGGQRQALTLLMAAMRDPKLLLLDEHTAALDPKTAARVLALTNRIVGEYGLTTIMVTHSMRDAIDCGGRLIMMREGRIVYAAEGVQKNGLKAADLIGKFQSDAPAAC
ncbi:MAG: ATP-binding cassette domain-containing protein [Clostridiales bacterium]|nr:ATP-binding cassette domain-containing protein [Clostridiales bacterium]